MAEKWIVLRSGLLMWCLLSGTAFGFDEGMPPQISNTMLQKEQIVNRPDYTLQCNAKGQPPPTYKWKKDGVPLDDTRGSFKVFKNGTLYFKDFSDSENGLYQCEASNIYGTSVSVNIPLVKAKLPPDTKDQTARTPLPLIADENEAFSFRCDEPPSTVPTFTKRWYWGAEYNELRETDRVGTDSLGNLRFAFTEPSDSKIYTCGLVPPEIQYGTPKIGYNYVELKVNPSTSVVDSKGPELQFKSPNVKVFAGEEVTLECFFSGKPVPNITWFGTNHGKITSDNPKFTIEDFGRRLKIHKAEQTDEGEFGCAAKNGYGSELTENIIVNVTSPPMKIPHGGLTGMVRSDRHDITLQCKAEAALYEHLNTPVWFRNGFRLNEDNLPDSQRYIFSTDYTELTIRNPNKTVDTATFQCNVSNSEGYAFYDGYLKVIDSIKITKRPDERIELSKGKIIDISIHSEGDICCERIQTWFLDGKQISDEDLNMVPFIGNQNNRKFDPDSVDNKTLASRLGHYTVNVTNKYEDFQEVKFYIFLQDSEELTGDTAGAGLWWIAILCGILLIIIAVVVIIIIKKTNWPRDTYDLAKKELQNHLNPKEDLLEQSFQEI